jgi:hypothetical protein
MCHPEKNPKVCKRRSAETAEPQKDLLIFCGCGLTSITAERIAPLFCASALSAVLHIRNRAPRGVGCNRGARQRTVAEVIEAEIVKVLSLMGMGRAMLPLDG